MNYKILSVVDSREKMEVPDGKGDTRMIGIPGTGNRRPCDTCGKIHEIHVTIDIGNGLRVVGLGCAKKDPKTHVALLLQEIGELVQELGIPEVSMPTDFVSRLVANPKFPESAEAYLDGRWALYANYKKMTKAQHITVNKIGNRGRKIRQLLKEMEP